MKLTKAIIAIASVGMICRTTTHSSRRLGVKPPYQRVSPTNAAA